MGLRHHILAWCRGQLPHKNGSPLCGMSLLYDFKTSSFPPSHINMTIVTRFHLKFPPAKVPQTNLVVRLFTCPLGQSNSTPLPQHTNKHFIKCTFSKSLTHNQANLKDPIIRVSKYRSKVIKNEEGFEWTPQTTEGPLRHSVQRFLFQVQLPICGFNT